MDIINITMFHLGVAVFSIFLVLAIVIAISVLKKQKEEMLNYKDEHEID